MDSQMEALTQYNERPSKRPRYSRGLKRKTYKKRKIPAPRYGQLTAMRWSSQGANNSHLEIIGNDTIFSGNSTTTFAMSNVNGYTEFVNLFDNFRITRVMYRWVITRNPDQATGAGNKGIYPRIVWTHDFNDSTPIGRDAIYQRANPREFYFGDNKQQSPWYTLKPACLMQIYESATAAAYGPKWGQWMDTNDNATLHYGLKYAWDQCFAGVTIRLEAKICMDFKGIS